MRLYRVKKKTTAGLPVPTKGVIFLPFCAFLCGEILNDYFVFNFRIKRAECIPFSLGCGIVIKNKDERMLELRRITPGN